MLNRRGHIATWMIFIGALVLLALAVVTFLGFHGQFGGVIGDIQKTSFAFSNDVYYVHQIFPELVAQSARESGMGGGDFLSKFKEDLKNRAIVIDSAGNLSGNFLGRLREGDYEILPAENGAYDIVLRDVFVKAGGEGNELYTSFELSVRFNSEGLAS